MSIATASPQVAGTSIGPADQDLGEMLKSATSKTEVLYYLRVIGKNGENAGMMGWTTSVALQLRTADAEVATAALTALSKMGEYASEYQSQIADFLALNYSPKVRAAAAAAIGACGFKAAIFDQRLKNCFDEDDEGLVAAAALALGQIGAENQVDSLTKLLTKTESPKIGAAAVEALGLLNAGAAQAETIAGKLDNDKTRYAALTALANLAAKGESAPAQYLDKIIAKGITDKDMQTRQMAGNAIMSMPESMNKTSAQALVELLKDKAPATRCAAALALGIMGAEALEYADDIAKLLKDEAEDQHWKINQVGGGSGRGDACLRRPKCAAMFALAEIGSTNHMTQIAKGLSHHLWDVRLIAVECFGWFGSDAMTFGDSIAQCLDDDVYIIRAKTCTTLAAIGAEEFASFIAELLEDKSPTVVVAATIALGDLGYEGSKYSNEVFKLLDSPSNEIKAAAIRALGNFGEIGQGYAGIIASMLSDGTPPAVLCEAIEALGKLGAHGAAFAEDVSYFLNDYNPLVADAASRALAMMNEANLALGY